MDKFRSIIKWGGIGLVAFIICLACFRHMMLVRESWDIQPLGRMIDVDGKKMSLYTEGKGDKTLVFLSGGGTASPILDFKSLYKRLSHDYKIVVVEKFGYGFSQETLDKRDNANLLAETRQALQEAGFQGPYVLIPHSMSGIQALYWVQEFPEEVEAIIGLDMALPASYENMEINLLLLTLSNWAVKVGFSRLIPPKMNAAIAAGDLTSSEKELYLKLLNRNLANQTVINESKQIQQNAAEIGDFQAPVPTLLFISNGQGTSFSKQEWQKFQLDYLKGLENGKYHILDKPHYLQDFAYEPISQEIKAFLKNLNSADKE